MRIRELQKEAFVLAENKGWHEKPLNVPEQLALIHSEISEALEEYRLPDSDLTSERYEDTKPVGFSSEMADAVIRIAHLCERLGIDLEKAIESKQIFNWARPHRHGGLRC